MGRVSCIVVCLVTQILTHTACASLPSDLEPKLKSYLEKGLKNNKFVGLSVLILSQNGEAVRLHLGNRDIENSLTPNDETIYEIGSITKPFARLALASQGKIQPDDPISKYLPKDTKVPRPKGEEITIRHIMSHTGIRYSVPCTVRKSDPTKPICFGITLDEELTDPYLETTRKGLYDFVNEFSYTVDEFPEAFPKPGTFYSYSNVGIGLLGECIGQEYGTSFEGFLKERVLNPLGMNDSQITMNCESNSSCENLAKVYSKHKIEDNWGARSLWHLPRTSAAGGLRSNLKDMEIFLKASLHPEKSILEAQIAKLQEPLEEITKAHNDNICKSGETPHTHNCNPSKKFYFYGWEAVSPKTVFYHAGGTGASQAMVMFSTDRSDGVVVLSNSKIGKGEQTLFHYPNDVAVCVYQLLGKPITSVDYCKRISE